jgi:hypothetical protein
MEPWEVGPALLRAETSEWFDWVRRELPLGGVRLPEEETSVLFIEQALHLADRLRGTYCHLPESLRLKLLRAAIVYQCWEFQSRGRVRGTFSEQPPLLPAVAAKTYLGPLSGTGRRHLVEASDGCRYVVTIPSGLWTELVPATEMICNELARRLGLAVPDAAVVSVGAEILKLADRHSPEWAHAKTRCSAQPCCGFRYLGSDAEEYAYSVARPPRDRRDRNMLIGVLVFDIWVANFRAGQLRRVHDDATAQSSVMLVDNSQCLAGSDWTRFLTTSAFVERCTEVQLGAGNERQLREWVRRIKSLDLNSVWQLAFEIPSSWYSGRRAAIAEVLDGLDLRRCYLQAEIDRLLQSNGAAGLNRKRCESSRECVTRLCCKIMA